jgi:hypothetical protein
MSNDHVQHTWLIRPKPQDMQGKRLPPGPQVFRAQRWHVDPPKPTLQKWRVAIGIKWQQQQRQQVRNVWGRRCRAGRCLLDIRFACAALTGRHIRPKTSIAASGCCCCYTILSPGAHTHAARETDPAGLVSLGPSQGTHSLSLL